MTSVTGLLDDLDEQTEGSGTTNLGELVSMIGDRGSGALLLVPALLGLSPLGMIPTVPTLLALTIAVVAVQIAMGRDRVWLPEALENRELDEEKLDSAIDKMRPVGQWLDRHFGNRLTSLCSDTATRLAAIVCLGLCAMVPPAELAPGLAAVPLAGVAAIGLGLLLADGAVMLAAFCLAVALPFFAFWAI